MLGVFDEVQSTRDVRDAVGLAVSEACTNVVIHAYPEPDTDGVIEVVAWSEPTSFVVTVSDRGQGLTSRSDSPGIGMGLPLIASVCDTVEFLDGPQGAGLTVRMRFAATG